MSTYTGASAELACCELGEWLDAFGSCEEGSECAEVALHSQVFPSFGGSVGLEMKKEFAFLGNSHYC